MKKILFSLLMFTAVLAVANPIEIKSARADKSKSSITYHMVHPMHSWDGVSKDVDGVIQYDAQTGQIIKVAILTKIASFDTKNSNRDSHTLEVTEAIKYPSVSFVSSSVKDNGTTVEVTGTITFHGVSKQITFTAKEEAVNKHKVISGEFTLLLEDFKIERPSMMMMKTNNDFNLSFFVDFPIN